MEKIELNITEIKEKKDNELKKIIIKYWTDILANNTRLDPRSIFTNSLGKGEMKYIQLTKNRKDNSTWHQARLGVLTNNNFLFNIGKSDTKDCRKCKKPETIKHLIEECELNNYKGKTNDWLNENQKEIDKIFYIKNIKKNTVEPLKKCPFSKKSPLASPKKEPPSKKLPKV